MSLLSFLFHESQTVQDRDSLVEDFQHMFEELDQVEGLEVKAKPLVRALKEIGIDTDAVEVNADGVVVDVPDSDHYEKIRSHLSEPDTMHKLAELGWVAAPAVSGAADRAIKFLSLTVTDDSEDEERTKDLEAMAKSAQELGDAPTPQQKEQREQNESASQMVDRLLDNA